ncbi:MAG: carbohydrate porin [Proteobacteria bacterium]|nr:carbohydrate porin [Pseudomonadota bacterium]
MQTIPDRAAIAARLLLCLPLACALPLTAHADEAAAPENWSLHAQATWVDQYHGDFRSPYAGVNSLSARAQAKETFDLTLFVGARLWHGGEFYLNPEIDQGFGFDNTLGVAGFTSGEAYKVGRSSPYGRLHRAFLRQTFDLGGGAETVAADANQLAGTRTKNRVVLTLGKFAVTDVFDTNAYAHDPRGDFLNWSIIDGGAFDYAADAWGYTLGAAGEWTQGGWTLRAGVFNLSKVPNATQLETDFRQREVLAELERRYALAGKPGAVRWLAFSNRGRMGSYADAIALGQATNTIPSTALVRRMASRDGVAINVEQQLADDLGAFVRIGRNDGSKEAFEFTEINRSVAAGLSWKGAAWGRAQDTLGVAGVVNGLSAPARAYFAAGGIGILIGDGRLPHYGDEAIGEVYYNAAINGWLTVGLDYQFVDHPAYNRDRGPVNVIALRLHAQK